jgi:hypothetical protein
MGKPAMIERSPFYKGTLVQHKLSFLGYFRNTPVINVRNAEACIVGSQMQAVCIDTFR